MTGSELNQNFIIEVNGLTKRYGQLLAVDGISFKVRKGEFFGFLGPNGAGKTTTVRMLTGVIKADAGNALIMGFRSGSLKSKQMTVVIPETANAYGDLSALDNMMLMAKLYGVPSIEAKKRSSDYLQALGLLERSGSLVRTYSKGMKQRLVLAMALISDPEVLFLDEPTSGLDVQSARLMKDLLRDLNARGKTVFLTTHNMDEASQLCDRVAIINKGKIVVVDAPERLRMAISGRNSIEVSFSDGVDPDALKQLQGVNAVEKVGDRYRLYTDNPGELVTKLSEYSCAAGVKIVSLNTLAPSLEDAFVALTGKEDEHA
jgi:ABC-2 type transport system ATP-binding protein